MTGVTFYKGMTWAVVKARKPHHCWITGKKIAAGDKCWKPVTNGEDRMRRIAENALKPFDASLPKETQ